MTTLDLTLIPTSPDEVAALSLAAKAVGDAERAEALKGASKATTKKAATPASNINALLTFILSTRRAHLSKGETDFVIAVRKRLTDAKHEVTTHPEGCFSVEIGKGSKTLFSCHTDTCHSYTESNGATQKLAYDPAFGQLFLDPNEQAACLGADDGAGIFIMLSMIDAGVAGTYMFHRGEEKGGIGSRAVLAKTPDFLKKFDRCVAFDRPYTDEVICTQGMQECASVTAGQFIADQLTTLGLPYKVSHKGTFTDSKVYRGIIRECFNIGVGYSEQHTKSEYQDVDHLMKLTQACIKLAWEAVPTVRVAVDDPKPGGRVYGGHGGYGGYGGYGNNLSAVAANNVGKGAKKPPANMQDLFEPELTALEEAASMTLLELEVWTGSEEVAEVIAQLQLELAAEKARVVSLQRLLGI